MIASLDSNRFQYIPNYACTTAKKVEAQEPHGALAYAAGGIQSIQIWVFTVFRRGIQSIQTGIQSIQTGIQSIQTGIQSIQTGIQTVVFRVFRVFRQVFCIQYPAW